jgi:diadenosine tetraphosphatase ApaH/serine/threonine PP2A family protein phosphatase
MAESQVAVFSDVHSNLEALEAVMTDAKANGIKRFVCLGDIVGYAASPAQCVDLVRGLKCPVLQGNHDAAASSNSDPDSSSMHDMALAGIEYSRKTLSHEQRTYLSNLPLTFSSGRSQYVHASLEEPGDWGYVMGSYDALAHFEKQELPVCFCGHTHVPAVWHPSRQGMLTYPTDGRVRLPEGGKTLVNVGSVGQPRDGNPLACYVVYDEIANTVEFRRVAYDIGKAGEKIVAAKLPVSLAERLSRGR